MRKTTGFLTNDADIKINRPLLVEPINPKKTHTCLITGIIILTHTLTFLLGVYVNEVWRHEDCLNDGSL